MNIIRRKRKELGISQKELSEKLGTSQQTISRIEKADIESIYWDQDSYVKRDWQIYLTYQ